MNDKTKSRPRKERWKGRKPNEKAVKLRGNVRRRLLAAKLWNPLVVRYLVATTVFRNFRDSVNSWLANKESAKMEGVR